MFDKFNPLSTYITNSIDKGASFLTFKDRLIGLIHVFMGKLDEPENKVATEVKQKLTHQNRPSKNHLGLYDYVTLGIPYVIESACRGNWIHDPFKRKLFQGIGLIGGWTYIAIVTGAIRYSTGFVFGLVLSPFVGIYHSCNKLVHHYKNPKRNSARLPEKGVSANENKLSPEAQQKIKDFKAYQIFLLNYYKVKNAFKNIPFDQSAEVQAAWKNEIRGYHHIALAAYESMSTVRLYTPGLLRQHAKLANLTKDPRFNYLQSYYKDSSNLNDLKQLFPKKVISASSKLKTQTPNQSAQEQSFQPEDFKHYQEFLSNYLLLKDDFKDIQNAKRESKDGVGMISATSPRREALELHRKATTRVQNISKEAQQNIPGFFQKCAKLGMDMPAGMKDAELYRQTPAKYSIRI